MRTPNPGDILLGKYRVEDVIGVGGMGRVVKASHLYLQQSVAIKILLPEMAESQSTVARFLREAQSTVRLRSEHIARVMDVGTMPDGCPFMVMEYLEGHDLNQILRHHGPQMPQAVVDLVLQACEGMAEAHAMGIIHRDIKPSNFFITRRPDGSNLLKILDFGISKTPAELSDLTGTQTVVGTPTYMAPEQMVSARSTDPRSDIWSIGVVMYQLLAGRPPFEAETYAQLVLQVGTAAPSPLHVALPPGLQEIVFRCLEKDPNRRIQSVGDLARVLAPYASDPMSAQQSAERASRILTSRGSQPRFPLAGSGGGLTLSPPALTPKSWNKTGGSSLSGGAGQMGTRVVRGGRGMVIAGVATLCVLAGIGGFFIASSMKSEPRSAAQDQEPAAPTLMRTLTPSPMPPPARPAIGSAAAKTATATPAAAGAKTAATGSAATTEPAKTATTKAASTNAATTNAATTKTATTKPETTKPETTSAAKPSTKASADAKSSRDRSDDHATKPAKTEASATRSTRTKTTRSTHQAKKPAKPATSRTDDLDDLFDDRK